MFNFEAAKKAIAKQEAEATVSDDTILVIDDERRFMKGQWTEGLQIFLAQKFDSVTNPPAAQKKRIQQAYERAKALRQWGEWERGEKQLLLGHLERAIAGSKVGTAGGDSGMVWEMVKKIPSERPFVIVGSLSTGIGRPRGSTTVELGS